MFGEFYDIRACTIIGKAVFNVHSRSSTATLNWTVKIVSISALIRNIPHDVIARQSLIAELTYWPVEN